MTANPDDPNEAGETSPLAPSDTALVRACLDGDQSAWETLVDRYGRLIYAVARRTGLDASDADDILQLVFTTLFRRLNGLRDQTRLSSWLITTTYRESWRLARRNQPHDDLEAAANRLADTGLPPAEIVARAERDQLVREALNRLDARCRDLLEALFLEAEEPSYGTIGRRLGLAVGSIGPTRARCFKKLEVILVELGLDGAE